MNEAVIQLRSFGISKVGLICTKKKGSDCFQNQIVTVA